uniref:Tetratricopeptide repeat protein 38 n=1 Tax=Meloidogyne incognita TaxID=6306 RepID=A0A914M3J1_MELIC
MENFCLENLRGKEAWLKEKLPLNVYSDETSKLFDSALRQLISWFECEQIGGLLGTIEKMNKSEPDFLLGKTLKLGLDTLSSGRSKRSDPTFEQELTDLVKDANLRGNERERKHAYAVQLFADSEMHRACNEWEDILVEYPNDLMALKFAHTGYFYIGEHLAMRDSIARVIDKWDKERYPGYSYLHGMYAYGLEESGEYIEAEKQAKMGLQLQRQDCWSTHAIAHCMEMASDFNNGINFLESTENDWSQCKLLHGHNYWHNALFYIEKGDFEAALTIYDNKLAPKTSKKSFTLMELIDASSLLSRLELERINVGRERWEGLIPLIEPHIGDQIIAFNDAHIAMVLSKLDNESIDGRGNLAYLHAKNISNFVG